MPIEAEPQAVDPVVAICIPIADKPTYQFWRSLRHLRCPGRLRADGEKWRGQTHVIDSCGLAIETARRLLTDEALSVPEVTHLLFIDDDMQFPAHALERLLAHDAPIVGGLCHNRRPPYHPILAKHPDPAWGLAADVYAFCYDYPPDALFDVDATGAAFLLVKREVFEKVGEEFGANSWWQPLGSEMSEDFAFCARAKKLGYKILVDTGLEIGHVAQVVIDKRTAQALRADTPADGWQRWREAPSAMPRRGEKPAASVIIPTFNQRPAWLKAAALSALNQTAPTEVIVVDDGSTEYIPAEYQAPTTARRTDRVWMPEGVRVIRHEANRGISEALNTGIRAMSTDWFCWLSSDDLMDREKIETQRRALEQAGLKCGFHGYTTITELGSYYSRFTILPDWRTMDEQRRMLASTCAINGSTVMIHRSIFDDVGFFDPEFKYGQDWEMWCRIAEKHFWHRINRVLGSRRETTANLTQTIAIAEPSDAKRARRDEEDRRIREKYGRICEHCGR